MYFSNNSRCVLRKVRFLSPSFLNKFEKNLSIKKPKDDPTKPPLRVNIPDEPAEKDDPSNLLRKTKRPTEIRSPGASLSSGYQDDVFRKSKSEIHFSDVDGMFVSSKLDGASKESGAQHYHQNDSRTPDGVDFDLKAINTENASSPDFKINASDGVSFDNINNNSSVTFASSKRAGKREKKEAFTEDVAEEPVNQKTWYILVDVHPKNRGSVAREEAASAEQGYSTNSSWNQQNNFDAFSRSKTPKPKSDQNKPESLLQKSKNLSKFQLSKPNGKPRSRFEVQELEDEATYILYLRLNRQLQEKSCGVGCVPEKEFTTRTENSRDPLELMGDTFNKFSDARKKQKHRKSEPSLLVADKTVGGVQPEATDAVGKEFGDSQQKNIDWINPSQEERKDVPRFNQTDVEGVKPGDADASVKEGSSASSAEGQEKVFADFASSPSPDETAEMPKVEILPDASNLFLSNENLSSVTQNTPKEKKTSTTLKDDDIMYFTSETGAAAQQLAGESQNISTAQPESFYEKASPAVTENSEVYQNAGEGQVNPLSVENVLLEEAQNLSAVDSQEKLRENEIKEELKTEAPDAKSVQNYYYDASNELVSQSLSERQPTTSWNPDNSVQHASTSKAKEKPREANEKKYMSIHDDSDVPPENPVSKAPADIWKASGREKPQVESSKNDVTDFQTSASFVTIGRTETPPNSLKYGAAFPPLLKEALNTQLKLKKSISEKWNKVEIWSKDGHSKSGHSSEAREFSENSILFPKKENEGFDCECLFATREQIILNIIKNETESRSKCTDEPAEVAKEVERETVEGSVDSLTVMKKVKEMIQLDLDNVVKIFDDGRGGPSQELSSVVISKPDGWEVNREELEIQIAMRKNDMKLEAFIDSSMKDVPLNKNILGDEGNTYSPKHLPSRKESQTEIQLPSDQPNSVVMFNPKSEEFFICKEALAKAICRKVNEPLDEITQTFNILASSSKSSNNLKGGDSILVFDNETQSWKVDFSILEKRQQQLQLEEELTKRSELILETFEELEKTQIAAVPKPDSKEKKTFDYVKKEWKDYAEVKTPNEKTTKSKCPFKESNAEEIRKKNSDLYENLFVAKKKETRMDGTEKAAPGVGSSKPKKHSKPAHSGEKKEASASGARDSGPSSKGPEVPESKSKLPPPRKPATKEEDDNFWESFLKMNILPRDINEISKVPPSGKLPPPPPSVPPGSKLPVKEPDPGKPAKKIEPSILKIPIPFGRRVPASEKAKKEEVKREIPIKTPPPPSSSEKSEKPGVKAPPPPNQISKEEPKKIDPLIQPPKSDLPKQSPKLDPSKQPPKSSPPKQSPNLDPPKQPPKSDSPKLDPPKQPPKSDPPKLDSPKQSPKSDPSKLVPKSESAKNKTPSNPSNKIQEPKSPPGSKTVAPADHYVSDKIIEISRMKGKDQSKTKPNKIETVKLSIKSDHRLPSKVTEINLNKNCEKIKTPAEGQEKMIAEENPSKGNLKVPEETPTDKKPLHKKFEKYQTPFSDPDYEEKSMKIKSDIASNPNLKKLDNWNKTLVLHDIMKPPESVETWLKDETDKMATLLLKILQEASDRKPKKKQLPVKPRSGVSQLGKGNPYENIRKKQENTPDSFLFRVRTVNLALENEKKLKSTEEGKLSIKSKRLNDLPVQSAKTPKSLKIVDAHKLPVAVISPTLKSYQLPVNVEDRRSKNFLWGGDGVGDFVPTLREPFQNSKIPPDITEEIPGPEILKKISNTWKLLPVIDSQVTLFTLFRVFQLVNLGRSFLNPSNPDRVRRNAFTKLFSKYGPIVNVKGPLSGNVILIHKSEHLAAVFEQDAPVFVRSVFDSLEQIRKDADEKLLSCELSTDWTSPEWTDLKRASYDTSMRNCEKYLVIAEIAVDSLIGIIRKNRNSQNLVSEDFIEEIKRWSLEGLCTVLFEKSFGFMEGRIPNTSWVMEPDKLYVAIEKATQCLNKCERGFQMWRLMPTPSAAGLSQAYRSISSILSKQIYQAGVNLKNKNELLTSGNLFRSRELTLVESMLLNDGLSYEDITCNLVDILLIGTNVINSSLGFLLYNLALNTKIQNKLFRELKEVLPSKTTHLDHNKLASLKYLQACIKENLRLHVPIPLFYRLLQNDILLARYIVPKGTYVVMDQRASNEKKYVFDDPDKFMPERWLNEEKWMQEFQPFAAFPLCHGPKAEFAKKVVELQLLTCAAKIIRNFHVEYHYGEIQSSNTLINFPDKPLKLNFTERMS